LVVQGRDDDDDDDEEQQHGFPTTLNISVVLIFWSTRGLHVCQIAVHLCAVCFRSRSIKWVW